MSDYSLNTWLDTTVQNYQQYFGDCAKPVVWEVGSRDGNDGVELARRIYTGTEPWFWSNATIVALEPNPEQCVIIKRKYPEIQLLELAASNKGSFADFKVYHGDEGAVGSSSLNLDWKGDDLESHIIKVETRRLDTLIKDEMIDIMKIDCEGHSMEVVEGLGDKLKQIRVLHIETEKWTDSNIQMKAFMIPRGFLLVDEQEQYGGMPDQVWVRA